MKLKDYASEALGLLGQGRESECRDVLNRGTVALYGLGHRRGCRMPERRYPATAVRCRRHSRMNT